MKNTHLEHLEDEILNSGSAGGFNAITFLRQFSDMLTGKKTDLSITTKWDGAPAVVCGTEPVTGRFFVGTKSVFNKVKIKINESHQDIDANHTGEVATILHKCFDYLPRTEGIFQGDFIGLGGSDEYTPNTITYQFDGIVDAEIIVAPHTYYTAEKDLRDAIAHPMKFTITDTVYCKFVKPTARIFTGNYDTCAGSFADVSEPIQFAKQMAQTVTFLSDKKAKEIKKQLNACIREGRPVVNSEFDCDPMLLGFWALVKSIKDDALFLCRNNGPRSFIGQDEISAEGYVYSNELGTIKLVNRERFSYANFNNPKFTSV